MRQKTERPPRMLVEWRDPRVLRPYGRALKAHPAAQLQRIAESIAAFGFDQPIVLDTRGVVVKGHARREAALQLGLAEVPVVVRRDLAPEHIRPLRIADNKCAESDWHWEALRAELNALRAAGAKSMRTGWFPDELEALLDDAPPEIAFQQYDERIYPHGLATCPRCGERFVR